MPFDRHYNHPWPRGFVRYGGLTHHACRYYSAGEEAEDTVMHPVCLAVAVFRDSERTRLPSLYEDAGDNPRVDCLLCILEAW